MNIHYNSNNCIVSPSNYALNAANCAFRDSAGKWQQLNNPNVVPDIQNSVNNYAGLNSYNAPNTF